MDIDEDSTEKKPDFFENKYFFINQNQKIHENREIPWFFIGFSQKPLIFRDFQIFLGFGW